MSIVDALKKLVVAFGGASEPEEVPGANVADVIEELAKNPPSGGGAATPLVVNAKSETPAPKTKGRPENNGLILDRTFQEIEDAVLSGRSVLIYLLDELTNIYTYASPFMIGSTLDGANNIVYYVRIAEGEFVAETKDDYPQA